MGIISLQRVGGNLNQMSGRFVVDPFLVLGASWTDHLHLHKTFPPVT